MNQSPRMFILTVLAALLAVAWAGSRLLPKTDSAAPTSSTGNALIGGHFELVNTQGFTMTEKNFSGRSMLVYFGYTHCPDVCPTSLLVMQNAIRQLPAEAQKKIVPIFITVDPERDTVKAMAEYISHFDSSFIGLTGSAAQIKQAADAYKVYYAKIPDKKSSANYSMDHSGFLYLMGADGAYLAHFPYNISESDLNAALAKHLN